jgi:hypothetical protein
MIVLAALTIPTAVLVTIIGVGLSIVISLGAWVLSKVASLGESEARTSATLEESIKIISRVNDELDTTTGKVSDLSTVVARLDERTYDHSRRISVLEGTADKK